MVLVFKSWATAPVISISVKLIDVKVLILFLSVVGVVRVNCARKNKRDGVFKQ
jgi:hypothetical protein